MKCSEVREVLPEVIDGFWEREFQQHLQSCPDCEELVAELKLIAGESRQLAESHEPPARVWVGIAQQLRAEGIIREPEPARPVLVVRPARRWNAWWLAPVAAAILAAGAYQLTHKSAPPAVSQQTAQRTAPQAPAEQNATGQNMATTAAQQNAPASATPSGSGNTQSVATAQRSGLATKKTKNPEAPIVARSVTGKSEVSPPASDEDQQFLSEVSERAPTMRATYEKQLRAVNTEIQETQEYIKRYPGDLDARQHLMEVYQQKALLYQLALDRIQ
jgi:hypothetical protein